MSDYNLVPKNIVDELAQFIRQVDGNNRMGAGSLADKICERFRVDAPAVQREPVLDAPFGGILYLQVDGKPDQWRRINPCKLYAAPQPAEHKLCPDPLIGRTVSMDVSTGDHNAFHRLFGTVVGVEGQDGVILCELDEDNQDKQPAPDVAEEWSRAFLQISVVLEALTSSDSEERLSRMNAADVLGDAFATLGRIRQKSLPNVTQLVEALEEIIHPVRFMQERLEEGERLNGMAAVQLAEDSSYLRGIAIAAIAAHRKQGGEV